MKEDPYGIRDSRSFLVALNLSVFSQTMISWLVKISLTPKWTTTL
jgi:hypothetical protein